ncbi:MULTISPECIES: ThuA domain-containing protein [Microbacterium]|uniref:Trehalose utilization protein ThuA n=1 Tax=Microbacterium wangchenii TaxID=2541726 RepID=A0ABX5SX93_9MICO|nr:MULTISPECIES: ThuA domain-containing protein [Microbacterium]MCK6067641.1 ThuA domain-containing protein [Microbacterium sp. EYE_512]QBR89439.1 trehalose utilization protein ThuA [Microbacterium wangchenii]TXK11112.1 trehalose utilization protein ThuA [Microbacterium wangchenii]
MIRVLVWNEGEHERVDASVQAIYPDGMHTVIADGLREHLGDEVEVRTATLRDPEHGLSEEALAATDVLLWWGHMAHDAVDDAVVERVHRHVLSGMGILVLHSAHFSKIFIRLMGTTCSLAWRNDGEQELVWTVAPGHPIAEGIEQPLRIERQEMYGEFFDVPAPDELVFVSSFSGGEVFRSGMTYRRGRGRVFYFSPGDQEYPVYHHPQIRRVLANGVRWAHPGDSMRVLPAVTNPPRTHA